MYARRALAVAVALTLALAACGDDDGGSDTTTTTEAESTSTTEADDTTTTADDTTTTTEAVDDDPEAIAEAVNLTIDDFDSDWTLEPGGDDDDSLDITECFVDSDLQGNTLAQVDSDGFSQESSTEITLVGSTGIVTSGVGVASTVLGEATRSAFRECVLDQFESGLGEQGLTITESSLSSVPGLPTAAEQVVALNGVMSATDGTDSADFEVSIWLHRQGPVIAGVSVLALGAPDFAAVVDSSNDVVGERLVEVVG